jgi:hypothetical protein
MSVGMLAFVITRGVVCSLLAFGIWNGDTVPLHLVFGIMKSVEPMRQSREVCGVLTAQSTSKKKNS